MKCYPPNNVSFITHPVIESYSQLDNMELVDVHKDGRLPVILETAKRLQNEFSEQRFIGVNLPGPVSNAVALRSTSEL